MQKSSFMQILEFIVHLPILKLDDTKRLDKSLHASQFSSCQCRAIEGTGAPTDQGQTTNAKNAVTRSARISNGAIPADEPPWRVEMQAGEGF
jgi:hypothetical protein